MNRDLVSVVITTFSRPENLCTAIDSVISQSYSPIEIIVVDDNGEGTENQLLTERTIKKFIVNNQIKYIKHDINRNGSAARNTGLKNSNGFYINFLDDDDAFLPNKIQLQVEELRNSSARVGASYCNMVLEGPTYYLPTHNTKSGDLTEDILLEKSIFNTSTILFKREALLNINGWDDSFVRHQDWEIMIRFFRSYTIKLTGDIPLVRRFHVGSRIIKKKDWVVPTKEKYLETFKEDIKKTNSSKDIYQHHYFSLAVYLFSVGDLKNGFLYLSKAKKYKSLSIRQIQILIIKTLKNYYGIFREKINKV